jgi:hypothetical protein
MAMQSPDALRAIGLQQWPRAPVPVQLAPFAPYFADDTGLVSLMPFTRPPPPPPDPVPIDFAADGTPIFPQQPTPPPGAPVDFPELTTLPIPRDPAEPGPQRMLRHRALTETLSMNPTAAPVGQLAFNAADGTFHYHACVAPYSYTLPTGQLGSPFCPALPLHALWSAAAVEWALYQRWRKDLATTTVDGMPIVQDDLSGAIRLSRHARTPTVSVLPPLSGMLVRPRHLKGARKLQGGQRLTLYCARVDEDLTSGRTSATHEDPAAMPSSPDEPAAGVGAASAPGAAQPVGTALSSARNFTGMCLLLSAQPLSEIDVGLLAPTAVKVRSAAAPHAAPLPKDVAAAADPSFLWRQRHEPADPLAGERNHVDTRPGSATVGYVPLGTAFPYTFSTVPLSRRLRHPLDNTVSSLEFHGVAVEDDPADEPRDDDGPANNCLDTVGDVALGTSSRTVPNDDVSDGSEFSRTMLACASVRDAYAYAAAHQGLDATVLAPPPEDAAELAAQQSTHVSVLVLTWQMRLTILRLPREFFASHLAHLLPGSVLWLRADLPVDPPSDTTAFDSPLPLLGFSCNEDIVSNGVAPSRTHLRSVLAPQVFTHRALIVTVSDSLLARMPTVRPRAPADVTVCVHGGRLASLFYEAVARDALETMSAGIPLPADVTIKGLRAARVFLNGDAWKVVRECGAMGYQARPSGAAPKRGAGGYRRSKTQHLGWEGDNGAETWLVDLDEEEDAENPGIPDNLDYLTGNPAARFSEADLADAPRPYQGKKRGRKPKKLRTGVPALSRKLSSDVDLDDDSDDEDFTEARRHNRARRAPPLPSSLSGASHASAFSGSSLGALADADDTPLRFLDAAPAEVQEEVLQLARDDKLEIYRLLKKHTGYVVPGAKEDAPASEAVTDASDGLQHAHCIATDTDFAFDRPVEGLNLDQPGFRQVDVAKELALARQRQARFAKLRGADGFTNEYYFMSVQANATEFSAEFNEEDSSDAFYELTHSKFEKQERRLREGGRNVRWVICDAERCRKWRILEGKWEHPKFFCGYNTVPNAAACSPLDDWIVRCMNGDVALATRLAELGCQTVENLEDKPHVLDALRAAGITFDVDAQTLKRLE